MNKNVEKKFERWELKEIILGVLGISVLVGGTVIFSPNFPIVMGIIMKLIEEIKQIKIPVKKVKRVLKSLEENKIISLEKKKNEVYVRIKKEGKETVLKYSLQYLLDLNQKKKKWKRKWFLVIFDVPEEERIKRNHLRRFLRDIGFYQYQQSVYLYPYECEKEVSLIKEIVQGGKYISYIIAEKIEKEKEAKIFFNLN